MVPAGRIEPTSELWEGSMRWRRLQTKIDRLDSNNRVKKSKCFIWCRLGTRGPFFLSLSCTEFVPNSQSTQCCVVSHLLFPVYSFCAALPLLCSRSLE